MESSLELHKSYTIPEYFLLEESGEIRHEFNNGNLIEISGASREHHKICKRLLKLLDNLLSDKGYEVYIENMKVKIQNENQYYYPVGVVFKTINRSKNIKSRAGIS